jgi:hypothetical protein
MVQTDDKQVREVFERIIALRKLSISTGMKTYKSQSALLEALNPQVLAAVALLLEKENANDRTLQHAAR